MMEPVKQNGSTPSPLPATEPMAAVVEIRIAYLSDGKVHVQGPVANKVLCYGLLECAKTIIAAYDDSPILK